MGLVQVTVREVWLLIVIIGVIIFVGFKVQKINCRVVKSYIKNMNCYSQISLIVGIIEFNW